MGRKVFLSVLGTGFYNKCSYVDAQNKFKSKPTRFIQEATLDALGVEKWSERDAVYIFITKKACQENWDKSLKTRIKIMGPNKVEQKYTRLEQVLEDKHYAAKVEGVDIPDGLNHEEMWKVFETMFDKLEDGDRLYIDLTHGFRYLPMMMLVLCQYATFMKHASVSSMTYGNFEAVDRQANEAPLMDLSALTMLQGLTMGAAEFKKFGKMGTISDMFMQSASNKTERKFFQLLKDEATAMDESLATCRGLELQDGSHAVKAQEALHQLQTLDFPTPMKSLLSKMQAQVNVFGENDVQNLRAAVEWCIQYGMTQQGYTLCQESVITLLCEHFKDLDPFVDANMEDDERVLAFRNYMASIVGISKENLKDESKWKGSLVKFKPLTRALLHSDAIKKIRGAYSPLTFYRNQINHAGFVAPKGSKDIRQNLKANAKNCLDVIRSLPGSENISVTYEEKASLLINLSNHPYAIWDERQREAARMYGTCVDVDFPKVSSDMSSEELDNLVDDYEHVILRYADNHELTIHIMGEMTFCFRLIKRLQEKGIRCIASCTERNVVEQGNERIKSVYNFTRFREYGA